MWETSAQLTDAISLCPHWPRLGRQHISDRIPSQRRDATLKKKKSVREPNQDLVSANSERQRPVAKALSLQKVRWIYTYLTSADTSYGLVSFIGLPTYRVLNVHSVVNDSWIKNITLRYSSCSPCKKQKFFVCLILKLQITKKKKADSGLIRLSWAISTFKAKKCKYKWFVQADVLDLSWHFNACVWEKYIHIYYTYIHVHSRFMYTFYTKQFPLNYYLRYWDSNSIPFSVWDNRLFWFEDSFKYKN